VTGYRAGLAVLVSTAAVSPRYPYAVVIRRSRPVRSACAGEFAPGCLHRCAGRVRRAAGTLEDLAGPGEWGRAGPGLGLTGAGAAGTVLQSRS